MNSFDTNKLAVNLTLTQITMSGWPLQGCLHGPAFLLWGQRKVQFKDKYGPITNQELEISDGTDFLSRP